MQLRVPQKRLGAWSFFTCVMVIDLLLILAIDMYVPALPSMQRSFNVSVSYLNLTVFVFFAFSAVSMLLAGPISDRYGRRPVLLAGCGLFTASSLACAIAPSVEVLVVFRTTQALGYGLVATVETALIEDAFEGRDLKLAMTCLQSLIIIGPAAAPFLGTYLLSHGDWRLIFWFLTACGVISCVLAWLISETHCAQAGETAGVGAALRHMKSGVCELVRDRQFMSLTLFMGTAGMPYFAFIAVVSYVLLDFYGMTYFGYSVIYAIACVVTIIAPFVYMLLSKFFSVKTILKLCIGLTAASFVLFVGWGHAGPLLFLLVFVPYALAEGVVRPMAFVVLLDQPQDRVGTASSFANFGYSIMTSIATVLATLQWPTFIWAIAVLCGASAVIMAGLYAFGLRKVKG